jgi:hypothetical protein
MSDPDEELEPELQSRLPEICLISEVTQRASVEGPPGERIFGVSVGTMPGAIPVKVVSTKTGEVKQSLIQELPRKTLMLYLNEHLARQLRDVLDEALTHQREERSDE